jgi:hypothetical protein
MPPRLLRDGFPPVYEGHFPNLAEAAVAWLSCGGKRTGFHFARKRFMVPLDFAIGKLGYSINIKGLAETLSLWRAV